MLIRPSCAKDTNPSQSTPDGAIDNFTPGMGLKWLRDGQPSANLQAMWGVNGQNSWNFFKNDFSNHIPAASGVALKALALKFSSATKYVQTMGLRDLSIIGCNGQTRSPHRYPFKLVFKPNQGLRTKYPDYYQVDYMEQLKAVPSGTTIYEVYAVDQPNAPEKKIGEIRTTSQMVSSYWGDASLFFRHNYMDIDLQENPGWVDWTPYFSILGGGPKVLSSVDQGVNNTDQGEKKPGCPFLQ